MPGIYYGRPCPLGFHPHPTDVQISYLADLLTQSPFVERNLQRGFFYALNLTITWPGQRCLLNVLDRIGEKYALP